MSDPTKGQILPNSAFGKALTALAKQANSIVEVGTWRGEGSTRCLANGLWHPGQRMWTIEQDLNCWKEAQTGYRDARITFLHAHTMDVLDKLPAWIDLLLLDGHDEQTATEFDALRDRCRVIALDDTNELKNTRQRKLLLQAGWPVLHDNPTDRNGWAVFERPASTTKGTT